MGGKLKEVRERMVSVKSTQQITKAMKMVSAAKLRQSQGAVQQIRNYQAKLGVVAGKVLNALDPNNMPPLGTAQGVEHVLIVCITSDRGLCGAFNANIIKKVKKLIDEDYHNKQVTLWCIGKKGYEALLKMDYNVDNQFLTIAHPFDIEQIYACSDLLMQRFVKKKFNAVSLVYSRFYNAMKQEPTIEKMLPIKQEAAKEVKGKQLDYIYQQPITELLDYLLPSVIKAQLIKAILDSAASEHGARMSAMDQATENASELQKELKIIYNTARQAAITNELNEIVGGAAAL